MRIAQVAPLYESVPPRLYGGTERVVSYLTEQLVEAGHDVTLFASGDSQTRARLVAPCPEALRLANRRRWDVAHHVHLLELVRQELANFDVVHFHTEPFHFPMAQLLRKPQISTLHGRLDLAELLPLYSGLGDLPLVSISDAQRAPIAGANWQATVHHGLPGELFGVEPKAGDYLAFVGRISPEKRVDRAIDVAERVGMPLKVAAKIEEFDMAYYQEVAPRLKRWPVEFIGELGDADKGELLRNAYAMLFPIDWPEPFGLVMIEAMFCGTPVVGWRAGSVPELVEPGVTGFVVDSVDEAVLALERVGSMDRQRCAQAARGRFSVQRMADDYLGVYARLVQRAYRGTASAA